MTVSHINNGYLFMHIRIQEKIKILSIYNPETGKTIPHRMKWRGVIHRIKRVTYYHPERRGREMLHIFHMTDGHLDFRVSLHSETLSWTLEEVTDGESN